MKKSYACTQQSRIFHIAVAAASLFTLSGCSDDHGKREYAVPHSACGTPINSKVLTDFFPSGKKIGSTKTKNSQGAVKCALSVDGKLIVQTSQEWWNDMTVLEFARGMTLDDPDHRTGDGAYAYSGYQAFSKVTNCRNSEHQDQVLYTSFQASGSEYRDASAMKKIITDYTRSVESSTVCE